MSVLEAHDIRKDFPEGPETISVLRGVSLHLDRGEVVSLEGPSGSGKTTLLSILGCIMSPTAGRVIVEGRQVERDDPAALQAVRKRSIGFVFQQFNLIPSLTAAENVEYALNIKGLKGRAARHEAARVMNAVGLAAKLASYPRDLSGGQKQRVAVARALAGRSPILLVDEPTANLDAHSAQQILDLFQSLARSENRAVLVVTHDPKVRAVVDRVLTIREGKLCSQFDMHAGISPSPGTPGEGRGEGLLSPSPDLLAAGLAQRDPSPSPGVAAEEPRDPALPPTPTTPWTPPRRTAPEPFSMT
jgi:putative ABC transport system ATP-binding protein